MQDAITQDHADKVGELIPQGEPMKGGTRRQTVEGRERDKHADKRIIAVDVDARYPVGRSGLGEQRQTGSIALLDRGNHQSRWCLRSWDSRLGEWVQAIGWEGTGATASARKGGRAWA
jgi:hypothetical protein